MKKQPKKLALNTETVRTLTAPQLGDVAGGTGITQVGCKSWIGTCHRQF